MYFATHLVKRCLRKAPIVLTTRSFWHEPATGVGLHFKPSAKKIVVLTSTPTSRMARRTRRRHAALPEFPFTVVATGSLAPYADAGWPLCCLSRIKRCVKRAMK